MSNFVETFKDGKLGKNFGLPTGIKALDKAINGLQKRMSIGLAAAPKCGKTTLCDFAFVINPYLYMLSIGKLDNIEWIYFSYEIDRVSKEFKFAAFFMAYDYGIYNFYYKEKLYGITGDYLMGKQIHYNDDDTNECIPVSEEHEQILKKIYYERIVPMFGEYAEDGVTQIKPGKILIIEEPENPTGVYKYLYHHAEQNGEFKKVKFNVKEDGKTVTKERTVGYTANNPDKFTVIVTDHIRKLRIERGFSLKQTIDKYLEYSTLLRNWCGYTFIHIIHSNRNLANTDRLKYAGEWIFPTADDCKDSGNPAEECTIFMTLFNPNDEKYNLKKHFGVELSAYPFYRSIHITESRNTDCPVHIQVNMFGGINMFSSLNHD